MKFIHRIKKWYQSYSDQNAFITERMCANTSMWGV